MEKRSKKSLSRKLADNTADSLEKNVFTACSIGYFTYENEELQFDSHYFGQTDVDEGGSKVNETTVFDLASLTKPLVTALAVMALVENATVRLNDEIGSFFPGVGDKIANIPLSMLLTHSSGLPAHRPYYRVLGDFPQEDRKDAIVQLICNEELIFEKGRGTLYSDLGFILLGRLIENLTGRSLANFWVDEIARPMGLQAELFFPGPEGLGKDICAVTGLCSWSKKRLCGIVHDDNCRMLGGVAGHAGLFGTLTGMLALIGNLFLQYRGEMRHPAYDASILKKFLTRREGSTWAYGFDTPSQGVSSSGRFFSENTVGHLGFTGTSFWLDLARGCGIVLLTNRVLMGEDPAAIRAFRPLVHDTIMGYLIESRCQKRTLPR